MPSIHEEPNKRKATVLYYVTSKKGQADLKVFIADRRDRALTHEAVWWTDHRLRAQLSVCEVPRTEANLIIYYVERENEAGWKSASHALNGHLLPSNES